MWIWRQNRNICSLGVPVLSFFPFSCLHLKAGDGYEKFMPFVLQTHPWRILSICWLERILMVNMENHVSEMLSSREENACSESSEDLSSYHTWQKDVKKNILSNTPTGNGALFPPTSFLPDNTEYFILTDAKSDLNVLCNHDRRKPTNKNFEVNSVPVSLKWDFCLL